MARDKRVALAEIRNSMPTGGDLKGTTVWWTVRDVKISVDALKALYAKHGLDENPWFPAPITGEKAFRKALRLVKRELERYMVRPINESPEEVVVGIVKEDVDKANEDLDYAVEVKIRYDKTHESVRSTDGSHPVAIRVKEIYSELTDYFITHDIQKLLTYNIHRIMRAVNLRDAGGVYFVPVYYRDVLLKLSAVVEDLSPSASVDWIDVIGAQPSIQRATKRALEEELVKLQGKIEEFKLQGAQRANMARRLEDFDILRKKADIFSSMLSIKVDDLNKGIADCASVLEGLLGTAQEEWEKKNPHAAKKEKEAAEAEAKGAKKVAKVKRTAKAKKEPAKSKAEAKAAKAPAQVRKVKKAGTRKAPATKKPIKQAMKEAAAKVEAEDKAAKRKKAPAAKKERVVAKKGKVTVTKAA
jgi:hypothetical protein